MKDSVLVESTSRQSSPLAHPPSQPVRSWAVVGVLFACLEIYVLAAWILSGKATPTPHGPTPIPTWMVVTARMWEVLGLVAYAVVAWLLVIRPWHRARSLGTDGILFLVMTTLFWQDPLLNWVVHVGTYNSVFFNLGNWTTNIPGWFSPRANLVAEPVFWVIPVYPTVVFGCSLLGCGVMRRAKARWPHFGRFRLLAVCFVVMAVLDVVVECMWLRLGYYSFAGTVRSLTLFAGHHYQFPLYEALFGGGLFTAWAALRYFTNDKGETVADSGLHNLRLNERRKTGLRLLANLGLANLIFFGVYNLPMIFMSLHADAWPADIQNRSYLTNMVCGPATAHPCPSKALPIER